MKKFLVLATLLLASCQNPFIDPSPTITVDDIIMESDFSPPSGPELGWGNDGPFEHRLVSARSSDGITWVRTERVITEQANTPNMVLNDQGQIMLYYTGSNISDESHSMAVAISDYGDEWIFKNLIIHGEPEGTSPGGDPDVVRLDNGTYRLYYSAHLNKDAHQGIVYAESENGIEFEYKGQVLYDDDYQIQDSITFQADDQWIMVTLDGFASHMIHATSEDGTQFEIESVQEIDLGGGPVTLANTIEGEDGSIIMYGFNFKNGFYQFNSATGLEWTDGGQMDFELDDESKVEHIYLKDPSVVELNDGSYFMVYVTRAVDLDLISTYNGPLETTSDCSDDYCYDCSITLLSDGRPVDLGWDLVCRSAYRDSFSPENDRYSYFEDLTMKVYDYTTRISNEMMTIPEDTYGLSVFWAPSGNRLAAVVMNWDYPDLTKVYILDLDPNGRLAKKSTHLLKVRFGCHDAGCNAEEENFWFEDDDTIKYQTWEGDDPYDEDNVSLVTYQL